MTELIPAGSTLIAIAGVFLFGIAIVLGAMVCIRFCWKALRGDYDGNVKRR